MNISEVLKRLPGLNGKNKLCILSGGLDSTILLYLLKHKYKDNVLAFSVDYKQRHSIELEMAKKTCEELSVPHMVVPLHFYGDMISKVSSLSDSKIVEMPTIEDVLGQPQPVTYVPFRNLLFTTIALSFAEATQCDSIFIGLQAHDLYSYWDTTPEFIERLNKIADLNRENRIQIYAPFVNLNKKEEIIIGKELGVNFKNTWTCYTGPDENGQACSTCPSCSERIKNFMDAGLIDPIKYKNEIPWVSTSTEED